MTHAFVILFLIRWMAASGGPQPVFAFDSDSLGARLVRIGGAPAPDSSGRPDWRSVCDSAGGSAWYEVELIDKPSGAALRFPAEAASLRQGLGRACREGGEVPPARVAAGLKSMASRLRVRMRGPDGEAGP